MARPVKNYCDYFSHDRDMRNHKKIKAVRTKYGITGYGIWCMLLEYLTGNDGNVFEYSDIELELMSGDFGVSVTEIRDVLNYCIKLELLFLKDGFINSDSLDERLKSVYEKRGIAKERSKKQSRSNGKFSSNKSDTTEVSVTEMPQSKVNKSKVEESKIKEFPKNPHADDLNGLPEQKVNAAIESIWRTQSNKITQEDILSMWNVFKIQNITGDKFYNNENDVHSHFLNWIKKQDFKKRPTPTLIGQPTPEEDATRKILREVNQK